MNSNLFHNIANILMIVLAGATAVLLAMGCTTLDTGAIECSKSTFLRPELMTIAVTVIGVLKVIVNIARDGFGGLTKPQPPVEQ